MVLEEDGMTLREMCDVVGIDEAPLECAFLIAAFLRTIVQGEPSTFEGECASLVRASEHYDLQSGDSIREWLSRMGRVPDMSMPSSWWKALAEADRDDEEEEDL